jgi:hypothetical protein
MTALALLLSIIFSVLAAIHFNWVVGGQWGFDNSLPTKESGERVLNPKKIDSAIVAVGLTSFALLYLIISNAVKIELPNWIITYGGWIVPSIFMLRALGDFKYVGFFKKVKITNFGKMDTKFYSPLCLTIGVIGYAIQLASIR